MWQFLKDLWFEEWITIRVDKRILWVPIMYFAFTQIRAYYINMGIQIYQAFMQSQQEQKSPTDGEPGKLDHSQDNPNI